jgi:hypothetical protein
MHRDHIARLRRLGRVLNCPERLGRCPGIRILALMETWNSVAETDAIKPTKQSATTRRD